MVLGTSSESCRSLSSVKKLSSFARPDSRGRLSPHERLGQLSRYGLAAGPRLRVGVVLLIPDLGLLLDSSGLASRHTIGKNFG